MQHIIIKEFSLRLLSKVPLPRYVLSNLYFLFCSLFIYLSLVSTFGCFSFPGTSNLTSLSTDTSSTGTLLLLFLYKGLYKELLSFIRISSKCFHINFYKKFPVCIFFLLLLYFFEILSSSCDKNYFLVTKNFVGVTGILPNIKTFNLWI